jgi:hypothetical protein
MDRERRALGIQEKVFGVEHARADTTRRLLATILAKQA